MDWNVNRPGFFGGVDVDEVVLLLFATGLRMQGRNLATDLFVS